MQMPLPEFPLDVVVPDNFAEALRGLRDRGFLGSQKYQTQQWRAVREGAHPDILVFERMLVGRMARLGVPMFAHNMVRNDEYQLKLFNDGVSKARPGKSPHNFGCAVDIVHSTKAWQLAPPKQREANALAWRLIGHVGKDLAKQRGLTVVWGGDWSDPDGDGVGWDPAHWELGVWKQVKGDFPWRK